MPAPALPGLDDALEGASPAVPGVDDGSLEGDMSTPAQDELDPMFAADASAAFPDLEDEQLLSLQRAVLGLLGGGMG